MASYGLVADLAGLPGRARLVGKSLSQLPIDHNIYWYRVLRASGQIAFTKGSEQANMQTGLLQEEGVVVINNRIRMPDFAWQPDLSTLLHDLKF